MARYEPRSVSASVEVCYDINAFVPFADSVSGVSINPDGLLVRYLLPQGKNRDWQIEVVRLYGEVRRNGRPTHEVFWDPPWGCLPGQIKDVISVNFPPKLIPSSYDVCG